MICQKVNNMIQPSQNFQFILCRFYDDDKTLKGRFQTSSYSEYPWIGYSIKEDVPFCFCSHFWGKGRPTFFLCLKRLKKLSTKYNGPRKTIFFCSDIN